MRVLMSLCVGVSVCVSVCEQIQAIQERSLRVCVTFLEEIARQTGSVILEICAEQCNLHDQVNSG